MRLAKALTLAYELRSSSQTRRTFSRPSVFSMSFFAASPLLRVRQVMMTVSAPRRTKWRVASRPKLVFAPVTMTVLPSYGCSGF